MSVVASAARRGTITSPVGLAVIDPGSGEVVFQNATMAAALGGRLPPTVDRLHEMGQAGTEVLAAFAAVGRAPDDRSTVCTVPFGPPARRRADPGEIDVHLVKVHALRGKGSVIVMMVAPAVAAGGHVPPARLGRPLRFAYDLDFVVVAADQRLTDLGVEPAAQVGSHGLLWTHPTDIPAITPAIRAVGAGETAVADIPARLLVPGGRWAQASCRLGRLDGPSVMLVTTFTPAPAQAPTA